MEDIKQFKFSKQFITTFLMGLLCGLFVFVLFRLVSYAPADVHHHANFALYVNGVKDEFNDPTFYEEVQSCNGDQQNDPRTRTHMHDRINHIVHVHDYASTWGHFFANLGYGLTKEAIVTDDGVFIDGQDNRELIFVLNGQEVDSVANRPIASEDVLLISYGTESDSELTERAMHITANAGEYNEKPDPSSCSGSKNPTFMERLKHAVGIPSA